MNRQEQVYTMTDYYDGPRGGVADFLGRPHAYHSLWTDLEHDRRDVFELAPIDDAVLALAVESWAIWRRWRAAFDRGEVTLDTHPALPADRERYDELASLLTPVLSVRSEAHVTATAKFEWPTADSPLIGVIARVTWTVVDRPTPSATINRDSQQ